MEGSPRGEPWSVLHYERLPYFGSSQQLTEDETNNNLRFRNRVELPKATPPFVLLVCRRIDYHQFTFAVTYVISGAEYDRKGYYKQRRVVWVVWVVLFSLILASK